MESLASGQSRIASWLSTTMAKAIIVSCIILAVLSVLHVNHSRRHTPLKELIQGCKLRVSEIRQMQIAFGKAGLGGFEVNEGAMFVPAESHAEYLAAAAEYGAIPVELQGLSTADTETANPFLSRSQQASLDHTRRTGQIREMIKRLPFVDQAWFEMDRAVRRNAFEPVKQSAVVSVRVSSEGNLTDSNVTTIKEMVAGVVAGLQADNVVVIDLQSGAAVQHRTDQLTAKQREIRQIASNQERFYESRFREVLSDFQNLQISVNVRIEESDDQGQDQVAAIPHQIISAPYQPRPPQTAGANGMVSIDMGDEFRLDSADTQPPGAAVVTVNHQSNIQLEKRLRVAIEVPVATVIAKMGAPAKAPAAGPAVRLAERKSQLDEKFERLKISIVERVLPLFPKNKSAADGQPDDGHALTVMLGPTNPASAAAQQENVSTLSVVGNFLQTNWPSVVVLACGFVLITLVTRRPRVWTARDINERELPEVDLAVDTSPNDPQEAEVRLSQMIEKDPDSAAKIIETWIRDAA